ncbi:putative diacylglycerol O-acyltransferase [Dioscorea sansibarensis]
MAGESGFKIVLWHLIMFSIVFCLKKLIFAFEQTTIPNGWRRLDGSKLLANFVRAIRFAPILFWGRFGTPIPFQHPMYVVLGKPIELEEKPQTNHR